MTNEAPVEIHPPGLSRFSDRASEQAHSAPPERVFLTQMT